MKVIKNKGTDDTAPFPIFSFQIQLKGGGYMPKYMMIDCTSKWYDREKPYELVSCIDNGDGTISSNSLVDNLVLQTGQPVTHSSFSTI